MRKYFLLSFFTLLSVPSIQATTLTFQIAGATDTSDVPQTYGDNVTAATMGSFSYGSAQGFTPNVTVQYQTGIAGSGSSLQYWGSGYNNLVGVVFNDGDNDSGYRITFTAAPGYNVTLHSFDLGNWGSAVTLPGLQVLNENSVALLSLTNLNIPASSNPTAQSFSGPWTGTTLTILVNTTGLGGNSDNIGLDNIVFSQSAITSQAVPEPSSLALVGLGLGALGLVARRQRN